VRVLYVINNLTSGGAEKLLLDLIPLINEKENLAADILLLFDDNNVYYEPLQKKGVKVDIVKFNKKYDLRNIFEIRRHIIMGNYDIVHAHTFPTQLWVALARMFFGDKNIRFITTEHNTYNRRRGKFYFRLIEKFMYSRYDTIVSISEKTKDSLIDWIDPNKKSIYKHLVMENGIDLETIKNALPYKKCDLIDGMTADTKLICMVGRFTEQKDQPALIRAVSKLPEDVHLVLAGEGPLMNDNKALAEKSGISERVHFLGFRNDVPGILKTVDIVVLSSHWEGFGLAAVEGMAAGKPLIASDVDGLREVVKGAGILFNTEEELKNAIISLLNNNALYEEISQKCRDRAERYDIKRMAEDLIKLYSGGSNS
jgi:glycosyltransferase involved in cell wall biosynthesis